MALPSPLNAPTTRFLEWSVTVMQLVSLGGSRRQRKTATTITTKPSSTSSTSKARRRSGGRPRRLLGSGSLLVLHRGGKSFCSSLHSLEGLGLNAATGTTTGTTIAAVSSVTQTSRLQSSPVHTAPRPNFPSQPLTYSSRSTSSSTVLSKDEINASRFKSLERRVVCSLPSLWLKHDHFHQSSSWLRFCRFAKSSSSTSTSQLPRVSSSSSSSSPGSGQETCIKPNEKPSRIHSLLNLGPVLFDPTRAPRNPIVLAHGLYGFSVLGPSAFPRFQIHYWGKLLDILRDRIGAEVIVGSVPGTGAIQDRSRALHAMLKDHHQVKGREINFFGHSMGGLDARHLISHVRPQEYRPVSLTSVCTPHRGSPFMAWCQANIGVGSAARPDDKGKVVWPEKLTELDRMMPFSLKEPLLSRTKQGGVESTKEEDKGSFTLPALSTYVLDLLDSPAYSNLHPSFLKDHFNPSTPDVDGVKYFSVASRVGRLGFWHPLWLPKTILDAHESRLRELGIIDGGYEQLAGNDGLVPVASARWGEFLGVVEDADHWAMRGGAAFFRGAGPDARDGDGGRWSWQDLNALLGSWLAPPRPPSRAHPSARGEPGPGTAAERITNRLPQVPILDIRDTASKTSIGRRLSVDPAYPLDEVWPPSALVSPLRATAPGVQRATFDLGELYGALCRNLYEHGL